MFSPFIRHKVEQWFWVQKPPQTIPSTESPPAPVTTEPLSDALMNTGVTPFSNNPILARPGDCNEIVKQAQFKLQNNGFKVSVDGLFGPKTKRALTEFQKQHAETSYLASRGVLDAATFQVLGEQSRLKGKPASKPVETKELQACALTQDDHDMAAFKNGLVSLNYLRQADVERNPYRMDGMTRQAIFDFQRAQGLPSDGIMGAKTRETLAAELAKPAPDRLVASTPVLRIPAPISESLEVQDFALIARMPAPKGIHTKLVTLDLAAITGRALVGEASWYGGSGGQDGVTGDSTASGIKFEPSLPMVAVPKQHRDLYGSVVRIINRENGKSTLALAADTGVFHKEAYGGRVLDSSEGVAKALGYKKDGTTQVSWAVDVAATIAYREKNKLPFHFDGHVMIPAGPAVRGSQAAIQLAQNRSISLGEQQEKGVPKMPKVSTEAAEQVR